MKLSFKEQLFQKVSFNKMVVSHFHDKVLTEQIIREKGSKLLPHVTFQVDLRVSLAKKLK